MDFKRFQEPDSIFRPAPFWAINDRITPEETARQMGDMLDAGLCGGFFHSRHGLITDYLSDEWFAAMNAALAVAKKRDGYVWLYDEDLWPSGNAGGQVAGMKDEYRSATIRMQLLSPGETPQHQPDTEPKAAYIIRRSGMKLESAEYISVDDVAGRTDVERLLCRRVYAGKTGWWGGESYANLLHPEAMKEFMRLTHERYYEKLGAEFGKRVPGIFTDEPQIGEGWSAHGIPYYEGLPAKYGEWTGRDFWADLPYMFFDGPACRKIRLLMHRAILRQFCEAFSKPIFEWCEKHNIAHTGHYNAEDDLVTQIYSHCGGVMAHYRYQQIPGIDHLCRQTEPLTLALKQVSSAARQLGRKRVLTEIFGVSRHTNTFQEFKWIGDFDLVLGANLFCPHLTLYSARGRRKRDYPPNWNYQQTYWNELRPLNDYFTRISSVLSAGEAKVDVLLLHPAEGATAGHRFIASASVPLAGEDLGTVHRANGTLRKTVDSILWAGRDCDLGDENYLDEMGAVEKARLRIGKMAYSVVVVPPCRTWRPGTFRLLKQFVDNGGSLLFVGELPTELDCEPAADEWRALAARSWNVPCGKPQIQEAVEKLSPNRFTLRSPDGQPVPRSYVQHRTDRKQQMFFIVNSDANDSREYVFTLAGGAKSKDKTLTVWNALDGTRSSAGAVRVGDDVQVHFTLEPAGSILLVEEPKPAGRLRPTMALPDLSTATIAPLPERWAFERSEENVLVMDRISASLDGGASWWPEDLDFKVRRRLAEHFGTSDTLQWQPWVATRKKLFEGKGGPVVLRYRFRCAIEKPKSAFVVIEDLKKGSLKVNGQAVDVSNADWHWDHGFGKVEITSLVRRGENLVEFATDYNFLTEVEPAYVVGDFGARLADPYVGEIVDEPAQLSNGTWLGQGLAFYSGRITYRTTVNAKPAGNRVFLRLNRASGILFKARVNGKDAGSILWRPHVLEITRLLKTGKNEIEIELVSSRQNTLGPLHEKDGDDNMWVGPNAFEDDWCVRPELSLFDYGLLGGAELVYIKK
ncbi:MAG TPA: hypothetical protein VM141_00240 [Planctomycetota bacterium]|nr:hypothetical protein [Planctomycetota bacterium]